VRDTGPAGAGAVGGMTRMHSALRRAYFAVEQRRIATLVKAIRKERHSEVRHSYMPADYADKAEHYWGLMLTYYDLAKQAKSPFQSNSYRRVATECRAMAKEAFALLDAEARRKETRSRPSG
jgi:hypothetical protein